jgi:AAA+ superfamily predicted ATPase
MTNTRHELFETITEFPSAQAGRRFAALVGLDDFKDRLLKEARLLLDPGLLNEWSQRHHRTVLPLVETFQDRPPLFLFAGDVGTGKTALAESFGDPLAREARVAVTLYRLSLSTRGTGAVGEMTRLLASAFAEVRAAAQASRSASGKASTAVILLIDEADALAQSREFAQMHHEDRAGVNALIRGVDDLAAGRLPAIVVMCTNRLHAIDPAIRRRAAATFEFCRPSEAQRAVVLRSALAHAGISESELQALAKATGSTGDRQYGYTYSDLTQRLLPALALAAFPDRPITFRMAQEIVARTAPTPPFQNEVTR